MKTVVIYTLTFILFIWLHEPLKPVEREEKEEAWVVSFKSRFNSLSQQLLILPPSLLFLVLTFLMFCCWVRGTPETLSCMTPEALFYLSSLLILFFVIFSFRQWMTCGKKMTVTDSLRITGGAAKSFRSFHSFLLLVLVRKDLMLHSLGIFERYQTIVGRSQYFDSVLILWFSLLWKHPKWDIIVIPTKSKSRSRKLRPVLSIFWSSNFWKISGEPCLRCLNFLTHFWGYFITFMQRIFHTCIRRHETVTQSWRRWGREKRIIITLKNLYLHFSPSWSCKRDSSDCRRRRSKGALREGEESS